MRARWFVAKACADLFILLGLCCRQALGKQGLGCFHATKVARKIRQHPTIICAPRHWLLVGLAGQDIQPLLGQLRQRGIAPCLAIDTVDQPIAIGQVAWFQGQVLGTLQARLQGAGNHRFQPPGGGAVAVVQHSIHAQQAAPHKVVQLAAGFDRLSFDRLSHRCRHTVGG